MEPSQLATDELPNLATSPATSECATWATTTGQGKCQVPAMEQPDTKKQAWIRYLIDYRDLETRAIIRQYESTSPDTLEYNEATTTSVGDYPIFEFIKTIMVHSRDGFEDRKQSAPPSLIAATVKPTYSLRINSPAILNAIQSVVKYYPSQTLTGSAVTIPYPYAILCHHYDELTEFVKRCCDEEPAELCAKEKDAPTHVRMLLDFLDSTIMPQVREELERNARGKYTFEFLWVPLRPGVTCVENSRISNDWEASVVHSMSGSAFVHPPQDWVMHSWGLGFDGTYLGRTEREALRSPFDGEAAFEENMIFLKDEDDDNLDIQDDVKNAVKQGGMYWDSLKKKCQWYQGKSVSFPFNRIEALVVVDPKAYLEEHRYARPSLMPTVDCRQWRSDCVCSVCQGREKRGEKAWASKFEDYNDLTELSHPEGLTWHQQLLCPSVVPGFVFRTQTWEMLKVLDLSPPRFNANMIEYLVMEPVQLKRLKALALSYARTDKHDNMMDSEAWSANFVQGKGSGLIFLLHGKPGVGKTCTAECIAEFTRSPLMVLTTSDIGTDPKEVGNNLTREFKKAKSWGAVLLIDEADVFLERRSSRDLERNSLVAGFLRALEFYDGILFLTTNRVGSFDDAFISRIHVQLRYPEFTDEQRQRIWQNFVDKLHKERGSSMRLNATAKEYLKGTELRAIKWNGREIRNAFQTAVSLAEYDAEKDEEGKILVTDDHLRAVLELSKDFRLYLDEGLHKVPEAKRAAMRHERAEE